MGLHTSVWVCERVEMRESVCIWGLGGVSGGATVISLDIRSSLGFRIRFRFRVGIRCRIPHDTHGSVTYIYTLACDTFLAHTHLWVSMGGETGVIQVGVWGLGFRG